MWLVQLYKARDNTTQGVYSTDNCQIERIRNYIDPQEYESELRLCNNWEYENKKKILIFNKQQNEIILSSLQNERFMYYEHAVFYNFRNISSNILSLEYRENNDFLYRENNDFLIDFYVLTNIFIEFNIPDEILSAPNRGISFLRYIKGKTFSIGIIGNETPKYNIAFDDNCKYYYNINIDAETIVAVKKPFLFLMRLSRNYGETLSVYTFIEPRLIEEFNDYDIVVSNYDPGNDPPLRVYDIINHYFDIHNKAGLSHNNDINNHTDNFSYSLIRALLVPFKNDLAQNYYFKLHNDMGILQQGTNTYSPLVETPVCTYFPLFRPQLDNNGFFRSWPQYDPNDTSLYVYRFHSHLELRSDGRVNQFRLRMVHGNSVSYPIDCFITSSNYIPSWRSGSCDFTRPFRFVGASDCGGTDEWNDRTKIHNSNYLFMIVKPSSSNSYSIKGIGCGELTENIYNFSEFSADYELSNYIYADVLDEMQRVTFSESGYPVEGISNAIVDFRIANTQTCFVLFNESLVVNQDDFRSIYQAVTAPLPNAIVCYIGSSGTVPNTHRNKVIHSNAIVTDLDTNVRMPLVIKYIRYAKRLHQLFNE